MEPKFWKELVVPLKILFHAFIGGVLFTGIFIISWLISRFVHLVEADFHPYVIIAMTALEYLLLGIDAIISFVYIIKQAVKELKTI